MDRHTVAIIGAGPIGIGIAVACRRAGLDTVHVEAGQIGQEMIGWPPMTRWFSSPERIAIAGVPIQNIDQSKCTREEYLAYLRAVVLQFDLPIRTYERVETLRPDGDGFELATRTHLGATDVIRARHVVLTTGGMARPNRLDIPGENLPHVSHALRDPHVYFRRRVLVVGGRNSAAEAALRLYRVPAQVTVSYRGEALPSGVKHWLRPELEMLVRTGRIEGLFRTVPVEIRPEAVTLRSLDDDTRTDVPADFVLLMTGYVADMALFRQAGVELRGDRELPAFDPETMETNVPGLFVAGTATAGTQGSGVRVFLENCHVHAARIVAAITGGTRPEAVKPFEMPEA
jgi:thioredoxin reductase (NADPH)